MWQIGSPTVWVLDITTSGPSTQMFFATGFPTDNSGLTQAQAAGLATGLQTAVAALSGVTGCTLTAVAVSSPSLTLGTGSVTPGVQVTGSAPASSNMSTVVSGTQGLVVALISRSGGAATGALATVTDSQGNSWKQVARGSVPGVQYTRIECWAAAATQPVTALEISFTSNVARTWSWNITSWPSATGPLNLDAVSPDGSGVASSTTIATPSITPAFAGDLVIAAGHWPLSASTLATSGWTAMTAFDDGVLGSTRAAYTQPGLMGAQSASWTLSGGAQQAGVLTVAFLGSLLGLPQPPPANPAPSAALEFASSAWSSYSGALTLPAWASTSLQLVTKSPADTVLTLTQVNSVAAGLQTAAAALTGVSAATVALQAVTPATV
jgi:hypothetical protein